MMQIPVDLYEERLTQWLSLQNQSEETCNENKKALLFLLRLSKAQMVERHRGEEYPFIEEMKIFPDEYGLIEHNKWIESDNIEIKAYCLDVYARQKKDKRDIKRQASDAYLELYKKVHTPWYLVRSVIVRYYQKGCDQEYLNEVVKICPNIHGSWLKYISEKFAKDCKDNTDSYASTLDNMITSFEDKHNWYDAVDVLDALYSLNKMSREQYHLRRALLLESHFDYRVATQTETTYNMKVDIIQESYKEICKIKDHYSEIHNRIRNKMIEEQRVFVEKLQLYGAKDMDTIPQETIDFINNYIKEVPILKPEQLVITISKIPFPSSRQITAMSKSLVQAHPILYMSFGSSVAIGEKGQTIGKANTEESLKITVHKKIRNRIRFIAQVLLMDYLKRDLPLEEETFIGGLINQCKVSYIEDSRKYLWAKGIFEGCRDNMIAASHILVPQIERALVIKAQELYGDLTNYERNLHDQISLDRALTALKPYLKGVWYDELSFFLNNGADVNFRNEIAHGLMDPAIILKQGIYLWWLAIKMVFCEKEIFKKR